MNEHSIPSPENTQFSAKSGLRIAARIILVSIAIALVFIYVKGFYARDWTSNLFFAAFTIWAPLMVCLEKTIPRISFARYLPAVLAEQAQNHTSTAISVCLIFSVLVIEPEMTVPQAVWIYVWYFLALLHLFIAGILLGVAGQNIWDRLRHFTRANAHPFWPALRS